MNKYQINHILTFILSIICIEWVVQDVKTEPIDRAFIIMCILFVQVICYSINNEIKDQNK